MHKANVEQARRADSTENSPKTLTSRSDALRLLVRSVRDYAIFLLDPNGNVITWNEGAQRIKGYTESEILNRHFSVFYPEEVAAAGFPDHELEVARVTGRFEDEGWRIRKDGSRFWANVVITAVRDEAGNLLGFGKVTRDLTERRRIEEQVRELNKELQVRVSELANANRELEEQRTENEIFVYSASHDIRAPLVNLQGFSHEIKLANNEMRALLTEGDAIPESVRARARAILDENIQTSMKYVEVAVERLSTIVDGLLRLSRTGRVVYEWETVSLSAILPRVVESLAMIVAQRGAEVKMEDLPTVWGDSIAIEQLFANLVTNALQYLDPTRPGLIQIGVLPGEGDTRNFFVRDNGLGIPESALPNIFHVFQRFHPQVTGGEGTGLAIVSRIVQRHNGRIWVESKQGQGTTFYIALPVTPPTP